MSTIAERLESADAALDGCRADIKRIEAETVSLHDIFDAAGVAPGTMKERIVALHERAVDARNRNADLIAALNDYGSHAEGCAGVTCSCGLIAAIRGGTVVSAEYLAAHGAVFQGEESAELPGGERWMRESELIKLRAELEAERRGLRPWMNER